MISTPLVKSATLDLGRQPKTASGPFAPLRRSLIHSGPSLAYEGIAPEISLARGTPGFYGPGANDLQPIFEAPGCGGLPIRYPASRGTIELRRLIADYCTGLGLDVDPDEVIVTNGGTQAIHIAFSHLHHVASGKLQIGFLTPTWLTLPLNQVTLLGGSHQEIPSSLDNSGRWECDADWLQRVCEGDEVDACFVVNPSNPTGAVIDRRVHEILADTRKPIVLDVTYESMLFESAGRDAIVPRQRDHSTFLVGSLSKTFAVPGIRVGFLIPPPGATAACETILECHSMGVSTLSQNFATQCVEHWLQTKGAWFAPVMTEMAIRRDLTIDALRRCGFDVAVPTAGYYAFARVQAEWRGNSAKFAAILYSRFGVEVIPGNEFGAGYESFVRISYGNPPTRETLNEALRRIEAFVQEVHWPMVPF